MKKTIKLCIVSAICAAILTAAGCAQPEAAAPAVSESVVTSSAQTTDSDVSQSEDIEKDETDKKEEEKACHHDNCTISADLIRQCQDCGKETNLRPAGYITEEETVIKAGGIILTIEAGVYVPGDIEIKTEKLVKALEDASGLSYSDAKYNRNPVNVKVVKVVPPEGMDGFAAESEVYSAWAVSGDSRELLISAGDLLLGNSYAIAHELSHTLNYSNSSKFFCQVAGEGFAEYNCYKAIKLLEKNDPEMAYTIDQSYSSSYNMDISDPSVVYTQDMAYWMEHGFPFEYACNGSYALGFRLMTFLDAEYGDYSKWITVSDGLEGDDQNFPLEQQIAAFHKAYGEDVFDRFYSWLKENEQLFIVDYSSPFDYDLSGADAVTIYPFFMSFDCPTDLVNIMSNVKYSDLYIDLEETKKYLSEYKGRKLDNLTLNIAWLEDGCTAELFDADGKSVGVVTENGSVSLNNVSYVLLKGTGTLSEFKVTGYDGYSENQ